MRERERGRGGGSGRAFRIAYKQQVFVIDAAVGIANTPRGTYATTTATATTSGSRRRWVGGHPAWAYVVGVAIIVQFVPQAATLATTTATTT